MLEIIDSGAAQIDKHAKALRLGRYASPESPNNQDALLVEPEARIFAVADGVARSTGSDMAARAVCDEFYRQLTTPALRRTYEEVLDCFQYGYALDHIHRAALRTGSSTTFTGAIVTSDDMLTYAHAGDSRLYIRRDDHVQALTTEQVVGNDRRNVLYNFLGYTGHQSDIDRRIRLAPHGNTPAQHMVPDVEWGSFPVQTGDRYVLVTDGVTGDRDEDRLTDELLLERTSMKLGAKAAALALVELSTKLDDTTAVVFDIG